MAAQFIGKKSSDKTRNLEKEMEVFFLYQEHHCELKCKRSVMLDKVQEALISNQAGLPGSLDQATSIEVHTLQSIKKVIEKKEIDYSC